MWRVNEQGRLFAQGKPSSRDLRLLISIGNYTVREVFMKNRTRVWRNVYNTASA